MKVVSKILSLIMIVLSGRLMDLNKQERFLAASIQQEFDIYVFQMPWDEKLFGVKTDNNSDIVTYSQKLFKNPEEKPKLSDWYTSPGDEISLLQGIFSSQKENINWDLNFRKTFKYVVAAILGLVIVSIIGYGLWYL
ncbi:TPA: S-4TM family putative pore-forming effector [Enterococcus faecium]|uniref:S-4TM family putative pore-forming effector n=1 Tax=Enterococcus faecium TaxID=1352 RepID=UPI0011776B65|nr:S-4TM family putative pore-forming effector [Enterococcus faecium]EMF0353967.1 hypothetical protein [Enterococcus faecium]MBK1310255.1 hypothetical protein [Enterococcus faecium]MDW7854068.1 S-4TM family putative pore-forming effector [Enterococcus faecium]